MIDLQVAAESATLFRSIVLAQHYGHWAFERGDERLRRLTIRLDSWARDVVATVRADRSHEGSWDLVTGATELLAFTARVLDLPGAHGKTNADLANAMLTDAPSSAVRRGGDWGKLVDACGSDNRRKVRDALLARIGARQGTGRPHAIDITALYPAITAFRRTWTLIEPPDEAPAEFYRLHREIQRWRESAITEELARLAAWHERVTAVLDPAAPAAAATDAFTRAAQAAMKAGSFEPPRLRNGFEETTRAFRRTRYSVIREVADLVTQAPPSTGKLLSDLAADRSRPMAEIDQFVSQATEILGASSARARQQIATFQAGGEGGEELTSLQAALDAIEELMREVSR